MSTAAARMTADEFLATPETNRNENLVDGEYIVDSSTWLHQMIATRLLLALAYWTDTAVGGGRASIPGDVRIDDRNVYEPDVVWWPPARDPMHTGESHGMPGIAAEVRSPGTWKYDIGAKRDGYERAGLPELWLVDHLGGSVIVLGRSAPRVARFDVQVELLEADDLASPQLPGFALPLSKLFAT